MLAQSLTSEQDEEVQKEFQGLEQQLLQKEADQLPAAPTVCTFCGFPAVPRSFASLQCLLAASHCLARLWEGSDAQRVCPCPLEHQLLHKGAGKLPTSTMACPNQLLGRAISVSRLAGVHRIPCTAMHDLLCGTRTCSISACSSVCS